MLANICTNDEVIFRFEIFMMKQFSYDLEDLRNLPVYKKASALINEECDYWADRSFWDLYDEAQLAVN
jgi:hypothetical protein